MRCRQVTTKSTGVSAYEVEDNSHNCYIVTTFHEV